MGDFNRRLEREIPRLRRYARALTRNMVLADDLVQETLLRAVPEAASLGAWHRSASLAFHDHAQSIRKSGQAHHA